MARRTQRDHVLPVVRLLDPPVSDVVHLDEAICAAWIGALAAGFTD